MWKRLIERKPFVGKAGDVGDLRELELLRGAETSSFDYENYVRSHADMQDQDRRHRSSALCLRARSFYLRGHLLEAHRWLDLAEADLTGKSHRERLTAAIIHLHRAELLSLSAQNKELEKSISKGSRSESLTNCRIGTQQESPIPYCRQKIERAIQEVDTAERLLRDERHQPQWLIRANLGAAQVRIAKILYDHIQFCEEPDETVATAANRSGALEREILEVMQRLRVILDTLPFIPTKWNDLGDRQKESLTKIELMVFSLWQQLHVVACIAMNPELKSGTMSPAVMSQLRSAADNTRDDRWQELALSMRFNSLAKFASTTVQVIKVSVSSQKPKQFVLPEWNHVYDYFENACSKDNLEKLWDCRREHTAGQSTVIP
jgi:hypothetical protein